MNLLNRFQRDVVSYWIRFGHRTVEDIVRATFDLLSLGNDTLGQLRPIHYLSLLDPTAQWARDWTVSHGTVEVGGSTHEADPCSKGI